jgi:signal transduction histidine kinase
VRVLDEEAVELAIRDEGVGMTEDQAERCFDRFWQAELTDVRRFGGTGIGLYIVRSLVEAVRGQITVESAPGEGSTFRVVLRRADTVLADSSDVVLGPEDAGRGDRSIIREYMRQLGVKLETPG